MDFDEPQTTQQFRLKVRSALAERTTRDALTSALSRDDGMDGSSRELYRRLGDQGLLAPAWPAEYGGHEGDWTETVALLEELVSHRAPQSLYYISVQIVGSLLLQAGTPDQKERILPRLASGELAACILFTEPAFGSDLAGIRTGATRDGDGWVLNGHKKYNLKTAYADVALCVARTGEAPSKYEALTLFLVPLDAPGVTVRPIPSLADEQFHDVLLDDVRVGPDAVVGSVGTGWSLITRMFSAERSGLDYYARARYWLETATRAFGEAPGEPSDLQAASLGRHWARVDASRLLTGRVLQRLQEDNPDIALASLSKWHGSETAQRVAWWALESLGLPVVTEGEAVDGDPLEAAYREAAGMTISGGASEVLLEVVAGARLLDDVTEGRD